MSNNRAPLIAIIVSGLVAFLVVFFLVLPKRGDVSAARDKLVTTQQETGALRAQVAVLLEAQANAPAARATIRKVTGQLPATVDEPGILLLLHNAAQRSGVELTYTFGAPVAQAAGYSVVPVGLTVTGSYFSMAEFFFRIETFPRAAKILTATVAVGTSTGSSGSSASATPSPTTGLELSAQLSMELYTSDVSAGPGSDPGPTAGQPNPGA